jgi:hypothetical protein
VANFHKRPGVDEAGYDASQSLQVIPTGRTSRVYLVAGDGLDIHVEDEGIATATMSGGDMRGAHRDNTLSDWENHQTIREVKIKGVSPGQTKLWATFDGAQFTEPLTIDVVADRDSRRVGDSPATVSADARLAIQTASLRDAVLIVAEDQMNSAISRTSGFGRYDIPEYDWCGTFAFFCWRMAAEIKGVPNPFGSDKNVLRSPQKAIHWAMQPTTPGVLLRYKGGDPMTGKGTQDYIEIGEGGFDLQPADIVLLRVGNSNGWKHVCMVYEYDGALTTIDGNQGLPRSIKIVGSSKRDINLKLPDHSYSLVFLHVLV